MTAEHFDTVLIGLRQRQPYQVFTVVLNGGERFEIDHANALLIREGVAVFLAPGGVPIVFDHDSVLQLVMASSNNAQETP